MNRSGRRLGWTTIARLALCESMAGIQESNPHLFRVLKRVNPSPCSTQFRGRVGRAEVDIAGETTQDIPGYPVAVDQGKLSP